MISSKTVVDAVGYIATENFYVFFSNFSSHGYVLIPTRENPVKVFCDG